MMIRLTERMLNETAADAFFRRPTVIGFESGVCRCGATFFLLLHWCVYKDVGVYVSCLKSSRPSSVHPVHVVLGIQSEHHDTVTSSDVLLHCDKFPEVYL